MANSHEKYYYHDLATLRSGNADRVRTGRGFGVMIKPSWGNQDQLARPATPDLRL
jgi:hypothetical protein